MKRKRIYGFLGLFLAFILFGLNGIHGLAAEGSSEAVNAARDKAENLSTQLVETQKKEAELNKILNQAKYEAGVAAENVSSAQQDYSTAKGKLSAVVKSVNETNASIEELEADISKLKKEIEESQATIDTQYEGMKKRIQYMYEHSNENIVMRLIAQKSIMGVLNEAQYVLEISKYDRAQLETYRAAKNKLDNEMAILDEENKELQAKADELAVKKAIVDDLVAETGESYADAVSEANEANAAVIDYEKQMAEMEAKEKQLASQYADAQLELARQLAAAGYSEDLSGGLDGYTADDETYMAAIIQAEAGGESHDGKLAVGSVVMNRLKSSKFPNTVSGVILAPRQFEPVTTGRFQLILQRGPSSACRAVAREVLEGARNTDALFFMTTTLATQKNIFDRTVGTFHDHQYFYNYKQ